MLLKRAEKKFRDYYEPPREQTGNRSTEKSRQERTSSKSDKGEYIDFEEID